VPSTYDRAAGTGCEGGFSPGIIEMIALPGRRSPLGVGEQRPGTGTAPAIAFREWPFKFELLGARTVTADRR
jgi:hypothetical protein